TGETAREPRVNSWAVDEDRLVRTRKRASLQVAKSPPWPTPRASVAIREILPLFARAHPYKSSRGLRPLTFVCWQEDVSEDCTRLGVSAVASDLLAATSQPGDIYAVCVFAKEQCLRGGRRHDRLHTRALRLGGVRARNRSHPGRARVVGRGLSGAVRVGPFDRARRPLRPGAAANEPAE